MSATILSFPRKRARSLSERATQLAFEAKTTKLQSEVLLSHSEKLADAIKRRREMVAAEFQAHGGLL
jgi:hypothetical protein